MCSILKAQTSDFLECVSFESWGPRVQAKVAVKASASIRKASASVGECRTPAGIEITVSVITWGAGQKCQKSQELGFRDCGPYKCRCHFFHPRAVVAGQKCQQSLDRRTTCEQTAIQKLKSPIRKLKIHRSETKNHRFANGKFTDLEIRSLIRKLRFHDSETEIPDRKLKITDSEIKLKLHFLKQWGMGVGLGGGLRGGPGGGR